MIIKDLEVMLSSHLDKVENFVNDISEYLKEVSEIIILLIILGIGILLTIW